MAAGFHPLLESAPRPAPFVPLRRISLRTAIWSFLLGVALLCPALHLVALFPIPAITPHKIRLIAQHLPFVVLGSVVVGPLLEEVIFRGCIIQLGRRYLPVSVAVIASVVLFSVIHFPKGAGIVVLALPLGGLFTWMALQSRSLWPGFICHAAFNLAGFIFTASLGIYEKAMAHASDPTAASPFRDSVPPGLMAISGLLAVAGVMVLMRDFARSSREVATA